MLDLVIRDADIIDGTGRPRYRGDIAVANGTIAAIGSVAGAARREIDAAGLVVAPGFVDVHTHYDCQISWDPALTPSSWHGVTTVVMGNCGFSVAPCRPTHRELLMEMLLYVEGMPTETLRAGIRWEWETFPQYLDAVERARPSINVAAFIGHSAVRFYVMGDDATRRAATTAELATMQALISEAMQCGAIGFSTSESPTHFFGDGTPIPSRVSARDELRALCAALRAFPSRVVEVAPLHMFSGTDDKLADQAFYAELARECGAMVTWAPLLQSPFDRDGCLRIIDAAAEAQRAGARVYPQVGCRPLEVRISFDTAGIAIANNPFWRPILAKPRAERLALFGSTAFRDELRQMSSRGNWVAALGPRWEVIFVRMSPHADHQALIDDSVGAIAARRGADPVDTLLDLVLESDLACQFGIPIMNVDESVVGRLLKHPGGILALSDAGAHVDTLADQGFTSTLLSHWVRKRGVLSLEEAIRLVTSVPSRLYGLGQRGELQPGWAADLAVFDPERIDLERTELVNDLPGGAARLLQQPIGIEYVVVNGELLVDGGAATAARSGRLLRAG
jgi:N-acyl-D-aspartate/D-glutamate deacylase